MAHTAQLLYLSTLLCTTVAFRHAVTGATIKVNATEAEMTKDLKVIFHRRQIGGFFAYHDWLQVGSIHYEVLGKGTGTAENTIRNFTTPTGEEESGCSVGGACWPADLGSTRKTHVDIREFNRRWIRKWVRVPPVFHFDYPLPFFDMDYHLQSHDCQNYARDLAIFLHVDLNKIPFRDGWFWPASGRACFVRLINKSPKPIMVSSYDEKDMLQWKSYANAIVHQNQYIWIWGTKGALETSCEGFYVHVWDELGNTQMTSGWGHHVQAENSYQYRDGKVFAYNW